MSPSSGEVPQTPERRTSSSALFTTFRNFTTQRFIRSPTPPTSASSTTTPARTPSLGTNRSGSIISGHGDSVANPIAQHVVQTIGSGVLGGPAELDDLVAHLHSSCSLQQRSLAVEKICPLLGEYPVRNVLSMWAAASDLLLPEQSNEAAAVGYKLLKSCVALEHLTPVERNVFFGAASLRKADHSFRLRLDIISTLTNGGKNVEACESILPSFILSSLDERFQSSRDAFDAFKKANPRKKLDQPTQEAEDLALLFSYVTELSKFNPKIFSDEDVEQLFTKTMTICQETKQQSDIQNAIKLFDVVITYGHVPKSVLKPFLEVLCIIHRQLEDLQEQSWNTLSNILKSHIGQTAVSSLLHTLLHGSHRKSREYSVFRGVIQILQRLLVENGQTGLPTVPISLLFPALRASIKREHESLEALVVDLIDEILAEETMRELLCSEADWSDLTHIIHTCLERGDTRRARSATRMIIEKAAPATGPHFSPETTSTTVSVASTTGDPDFDTVSNPESSALPPVRTEPSYRGQEDNISKILIKLDSISNDVDLVQKAAIMELFMRFANRLTHSTAQNMLSFYTEQRYLHPSNGEWLGACRTMADGILKDDSRPRSLRIQCIDALRETYNTVAGLCPSDEVLQVAMLLLHRIEAEEDVEVLNAIVEFAVDMADHASPAGFADTIALLKRRLDRPQLSATSPATKSPSWIAPTAYSKPDHHLGSPCNVISTAIVRLFTRSVTRSARKIRALYEILLHISRSETIDSDARLTTLKLLFRLRADFNHSLIVSASSEGESIAAVLCRTTETAITTDDLNGSTSFDLSKHEDHISWREQRKTSGSSPHSSLNRQTGRQSHATGRISKPVPPLWMYPGPKGLPEEPTSRSSGVVFSHVDAEKYPLSDDVLDLEVTLWLELVISLLQKAPDWEIYSYVLVHIGPQLSNQSLVRSCVPQLKMLRSVICEQIRNSTFHEPPSYTLLKKADVAVCLFHILTVLISYHDHYEKSEEDDMVKTFLHGIAFWDRTSKWCIHALTVCCHETPLSVGKSLDNIVQKMSQIVTKPSTAIHILEFLTSVARMPELYKNFREAEFKIVFGVSFRYLQHIRDQRERAATSSSSHNNHRSLRHTGASRDLSSSPDVNAYKKKAAADDLPQYLYSLAYHVITFWFMGLKMEDRPRQIPWITKNLSYTDSTGKPIMEEQGQVIVDMMNMVAYSDRDETTRDDKFASPGDGEVWKKTWIVGHSLVTIETASRTGVSLTTSRRPCGTRYLFTRPLLAPAPRHQVPLTVGLASESFYTSSYVGILPDDIFQTYYAPLNLTDPPIPLPDDAMTRRAISAFDRNATVDNHKVGVIYIGEGQTHEKEILMNNMGSAAYTAFLDDLGTLVRLKGAKFNTGGLDVHNDMDGEYTYCWRDRCMELIFHIPTMMPTDPDDEMTYPNKKRHIGNDYVNIIFNDSGLPYNFDTIPSAFNYVHIVITPESKASFVDRRLAADPDGKNRYYKVQVITRPEFPDISPAVESKIICGKYVAAYCRLIAINASVFSQVWCVREGGESISSWRNRLREIKRLRERYGANDAPVPSPSSPVNHQSLSNLPNRDKQDFQSKTFNRTSVATFISEGTNRSSITSTSQDVAL